MDKELINNIIKYIKSDDVGALVSLIRNRPMTDEENQDIINFMYRLQPDIFDKLPYEG